MNGKLFFISFFLPNKTLNIFGLGQSTPLILKNIFYFLIMVKSKIKNRHKFDDNFATVILFDDNRNKT